MDLRSKTLAFKKSIAIISCVLEASLGARACVQVLCVQKTRRFAVAFSSPLRLSSQGNPDLPFLGVLIFLGLFSSQGNPKDPVVLKHQREVNHYGDSNSLPR